MSGWMEAKKQKLDQSIFKLTSNKSNCTLKATFFQPCDSQRIVNSNSGTHSIVNSHSKNWEWTLDKNSEMIFSLMISTGMLILLIFFPNLL